MRRRRVNVRRRMSTYGDVRRTISEAINFEVRLDFYVLPVRLTGGQNRSGPVWSPVSDRSRAGLDLILCWGSVSWGRSVFKCWFAAVGPSRPKPVRPGPVRSGLDRSQVRGPRDRKNIVVNTYSRSSSRSSRCNSIKICFGSSFS